MEQNSFFTGKISNYFTASGFGRVLVIRGRRGERVHELIEKTMKEAGILNGVVISGIATFQKINYHHVRDAAADPFDEIRSNDGAFEVTALEGLILNGEAHLHVAAQDHYTTIVGHLERETEILYVAEIVVAELLMDKKVERVKIAEGNNQFEIEN